MESEGSEPDMAACLAAARLSTSSTIYASYIWLSPKYRAWSKTSNLFSQGLVSTLQEWYLCYVFACFSQEGNAEFKRFWAGFNKKSAYEH